ncbi:MAG: NAD(P)H:quinone oxidoreductase [Gammaproteobacteria bacterium]
MKKILVLYYSRHGSVRELARCAAAGAGRVDGCEAVMRALPEVSAVSEASESEIPAHGDVYASLADLENCDGLLAGSPTRFGAAASALGYFFEQTSGLWMSGALDGKPAGVFTSSASMHGGQESTLLAMMRPLLHHGMVVVGIPYHRTRLAQTTGGGTPYGASHVAGADGALPLSDDEKSLAETLGQRVARCACALHGFTAAT